MSVYYHFISILLVRKYHRNKYDTGTALHLCTPIPSLVTINSSLATSCQPREAADINMMRAGVTGGLTPAHYKDPNQFGDSIMPIFYPALSG